MPCDRDYKIHEVESLNDIQYWINGNYLYITCSASKKNEASYLLCCFALGSHFLKINKTDFEVSNLINLFNEIKKLNFYNLPIETDEKTLAYIQNSLTYLILPNYHDSYRSDQWLKNNR